MNVTTNPIPAHHPWLERLATEPDRAVDALLRGVAYLPGLQRASPSEALIALMGDLTADAQEWQLLDQALLQWLRARRAATDDLLNRPGGLERFIRETGEAFRTAWRLHTSDRRMLTQSGDWVRSELFDLLRWADNFSLNATFDLGRSVLLAAVHLQESKEYRFLWLRVCDEAAAPRLRHRLDTALLGLASIPTGKAGGPSHDLIVGLSRWAFRLPQNEHSRNAVIQEWRAIKAAFPRQPGFWCGQWQAILDDERIAAHPFTNWLKEADPALQGKSQAAQSRRVPQLPKGIPRMIEEMKQECDKNGLTEPLRLRMLSLLDQLERYADATGEIYYFVTSSTNIAKIILDFSPNLALSLVRRALLWAPSDGHAWSIRASALDRLGRADLAELVLWEAIRRLPSNIVIRNELGIKLIRRGDYSKAEAILRKALTISPNEAKIHVNLARAIWLKGSIDDAMDLLKKFISSIYNEVALYTLGCMLVAEGQIEEAIEVQEKCIRMGARKNATILNRLISAGAAGREEVRAHLRQPRPQDSQQRVDWDLREAARTLEIEQAESSRLERISQVAQADLLFQLGEQHKTDALQLVDMALTDPADAYAQVVKGLALPEYREEMQGRIGRFAGSLPVRLALSPESVANDHWSELTRQFPELRHLVYLTQWSRDQANDAVKSALKEWCSEPIRWDDSWDAYFKATLANYLDSDEAPSNLSRLVHDALTQAVDVGFNATPLVA